MGRFAGIAIGTVFGAVFVFVNSGDPLPRPATLLLRLAAAAVAAVTILLAARLERGGGSPLASPARRDHREPTANAGREASAFGTGYRWVVVVEFVVLFVGFQVMRLLDAPPEAGVAWVALVVGVHFLALARVWRERSVLAPGVALSGLGALGLGLATTSSAEWVPFVSGVLSGAVLLLSSLVITSLRALERARGTEGSEWSETSSAR